MKRATLVALALLCPLLAAAQDEDKGDGWYRVELMILANRDPEAALSERWPLLPELAYPERRRFLESEPLAIAGDREYRLVTVEETIPPPRFDLMWERTVNELWRDYSNKQQLRQPALELESLVDFEVPRQRVPLPAEQRELNSQRRRIEASAGLEVLFHQAWLQRMSSREDSLPLIIDGSTRFGDYPELQGSVLLYSGRYLHIATNLWLNTGGNYLDADPTTAGWRMPRPPLPVEPEPEPEFAFQVDVTEDWLGIIPVIPGPEAEPPAGETGTEDPMDSPDVPEDADEDLERFEPVETLVVAEPPPEVFDAEAEAFADEGEGEERLHEPVSDEAVQAFLAEPVVDYPFRHGVLLQQSRRMRSGELHYIDHPLVGIVIRVSRHEFEPFITPDNPDLASAR